VSIPLFDRKSQGSLVEITQRFDLDTSKLGDLPIAINCVALYMCGTSGNYYYYGSIVVRAVNSRGEPGEVLEKIDAGFGPTYERWYSYSQSFRVTIPSKYKRSIYISYYTGGDQGLHTLLYASDRGVQPTTPSYMWTNISKKWEKLDIFYGHLGMNADIVVP